MSEAAGYLPPPRRGRAALFVAVPISVVLVVLVAILFTREPATDKKAKTPLQDKPAPAIVGTTLDGQAYDIDAYRGRWVVVNFFATWCIPCQREHPELRAFVAEHQQKGDAEVVSIVFQDEPAKVRTYFSENGGDWPVITSDEGRIALDYSVTGVPETYLIDPAGIVRGRLIGGVTRDGLNRTINTLNLELFPQDSSS